MKWIHRIVVLIAFLSAGLFAYQADKVSVCKIDIENTDSNFSKDTADSSAFIQPQGSYQFAANIKTNPLGIIKCFDILLPLIPQHQTITTTTEYAKVFTTQSKKVLVILYAFHFFW
ncbi:hypothetical protein [Flavobacterium hungaricum]|uniref:Uncharacterized protein n=1 Tax=Flavobacterium hungaricum TaxID=2082725 RepID=A0ABR9TF29_9FLAO|nr:hypothetical protein [Flavobacterium hungaricum]MBE8723958.1 hypothetical protein [Flavobacterium hungaricum]